MSRILVVEDNIGISNFVWVNLTLRGYQINNAYSGKDALALLKTQPPQLLLLDIWLPDMSGYDLLDACAESELTSSIPVIAFTAAAPEERERLEKHPQIAEVLYKPVSANQLLAAIQRHLSVTAGT
ncbi:MAG: response regulator [bacterium]|nr:response regulator [bacterium]